MELKLGNNKTEFPMLVSSNRTFMELKYEITSRGQLQNDLF